MDCNAQPAQADWWTFGREVELLVVRVKNNWSSSIG